MSASDGVAQRSLGVRRVGARVLRGAAGARYHDSVCGRTRGHAGSAVYTRRGCRCRRGAAGCLPCSCTRCDLFGSARARKLSKAASAPPGGQSAGAGARMMLMRAFGATVRAMTGRCLQAPLAKFVLEARSIAATPTGGGVREDSVRCTAVCRGDVRTAACGA